MLIEVDYNKCTLLHLSEERHAIAENFYNTFCGVLVYGDRIVAPISQRYFVRRNMSVKKDPSIFGRMLEKYGKVKTIPLGDGVIRSFRARDFDDFCMEVLDANPNAFVCFTENARG